MKKQFVDEMLKLVDDPKFVFLTGDLGFMALEPLQEALGSRFINCGIAEQNMVSVAAGLAQQGFKPWVYSIAPFLYKRAYEQMSLDCGLHNLPVKFVGAGVGFGYGIMSATHWATNDHGVLLTMPNMIVFKPAFNEDIEPVVNKMNSLQGPSYIGLGLDERPDGDYKSSNFPLNREILEGGSNTVILSVGSITGSLLYDLYKIPRIDCPTLYKISEMPMNKLPDGLYRFLRNHHKKDIIVVEEHVQRGSFGQELLSFLADNNLKFKSFKHFCVKEKCADGLYGSQKYMRKQYGIDPETIINYIKGL